MTRKTNYSDDQVKAWFAQGLTAYRIHKEFKVSHQRLYELMPERKHVVRTTEDLNRVSKLRMASNTTIKWLANWLWEELSK